MTTERNKLQKNLNTLTTEKNQLQESLTTKTKERDQLQNSLKVITAERDQLKNSLNSRTKERDQVQNILNTMTTERDQLKTRLRFYEKPCPEGWWKFDGSCYYLSSTKDTGGASQRACRAMDAEDVIINSREEQLFIHGLKKNVWIGMFKKDTEWKWVDSTTVTSTYWMPGEPSSQDGINCVEITQAASDPLKSWRVVSCGTNTFSVCEKKAS
uniref:C-type lectin domain-containing protein n=1 Tax=Esox lucius TaxID=8010 RepID=A0AAY5K9C5_ESOLU